MKLQVTLDALSTREAIERVRPFVDLVDIVEVGTPLLLEEGMRAVDQVRAAFPKVDILVDTKIWHNGARIARSAFGHGANLVTVLAGASDREVRAVVAVAHGFGAQVAADMSDLRGLVQRAEELEDLGVRYMMVPSGLRDVTGRTGYGAETRYERAMGGTPLALVRNVERALCGVAEVAVVDNITLANVGQVIECDPGLLLIGRAILNAPDPLVAAQEFRRIMG